MKKITVMIASLAFLCTGLFAKDIEVSVGAGERWYQRQTPVTAIWLEDTDGNFLKTIYLSPSYDGTIQLPVWKALDKTTKSVDVTATSTPRGGVHFVTQIDENTDYVIKAEINAKEDYNDSYGEKKFKGDGQPSVVYSCPMPGNFVEELTLKIDGYGEKNGNVNPDMSKITTAHKIIKMYNVIVFEEEE